MQIRKYGAVALAAAVALGTVAQAIPTDDYLMKAGAGDLYERKSSELVKTSTKSAHIKLIADTMIRDHTKSTSMVKAAAMQSGLHPAPPMLMSDQRMMIADLEKAHGADRDSLYIQQQKMAHEQALALHEDYSKSGDKPALRKAAGEIVPVVRHHIGMLNGSGMKH